MKKQTTLFCYGVKPTPKGDEGRPAPTTSSEEKRDDESGSGCGGSGEDSEDESASQRVCPTPSPSSPSVPISASVATSDALDLCSAQCCDLQWDSPNQPTSKSLLAATRRVQGEGKSKQARAVQKSWFTHYPWLSLCQTRQKLFCFYCQNAERRGLITFSTKGDNAFSKTGFCNWKKAGERLRKHEGSQLNLV